MSATIIDGKLISASARQQIAEETAAFTTESGVTPHLAAVLVGDDPASQVYVRNKERACEKCGLKSTLHRLSAETTQQQLMDLVAQLNADRTVHGILVQLPLPNHLDSTPVLDSIRPDKDVDGFHPENVGLMLQGRPRFLPCTPHGVMKMLEHENISTAGKHAVVIGRSDIVGKPMAGLLVQKGADATVTVCHSRTADIAAITRQADILVAAVGIPEFVKGDMIKPGAVVIDVGINRVNDKLVGDVEFAAAAEQASAITPVPGGVGPMTIAMLLRNTLEAAKQSV
ncbi:MAG: bifunctional methylenetetrahydrofolate dehydrogenase/methenyltetrahydrofolate cyclohydrolase FolD [Fuerstiella sp.]|nr:bifunctional methylenetetrahydrofolate dehydrogenase/methenyltetrahydrofolate cyclohydrolase FolD [Fuerstiella sp.]MCP4787116.1 bifunctional methylenetetrahydrofolate dehydrogenase/methenyltetrahydrofolate cyclohydrolase FolD [Fuerstiella sp.]MCP4859146.1 bifunctional methylenetetrahydrofolate dehydrogenase/methenyltetrahydrofolate cyclohydrolase FolD [Fuerstiella sp.]